MTREKQLESTSSSSLLQYFIAEKNSVMIISWVGQFAHESSNIIDKCREDISKSHAKWVILNFRDLSPQIDRTTIPFIARLQKHVREMPAVLKLTSMHPQLKNFLQEQGVLRPDEVANNLTEALKAIVESKVA